MKLKKLDELLKKAYRKRKWKPHGSALDVLIGTILSQNTSDVNSERAFESLKSGFKGWKSIDDAPLSKIEEAIKSGGLAKSKSRYIKSALNKVHQDHGRFSLEKIKYYPLEKGLDYLTSFDGVGSKTAACVLLFAFGKPIMPVDTHVHRVSWRMGLVPESDDREKTFKFWFDQSDNLDYYNLHLNIVRHGRRTCKSGSPLCGQCNLPRYCRYYKENVKNG